MRHLIQHLRQLRQTARRPAVTDVEISRFDRQMGAYDACTWSRIPTQETHAIPASVAGWLSGSCGEAR